MNYNSNKNKYLLKDINLDDIFIDKNIVLKFLGYGNRKAPDTISKIVEREIRNINDILDIKIYISEVDINKTPKECKKAFAVLYTIGDKIDFKMNDYMENCNMMAGIALDKIGIVCLDYINEKIKMYLKGKYDSLKISHEIYPGDKDFEVERQKDIYNYVKNKYNSIEIEINDYHQLSPIKSVAMLILMGDEENLESRCSKCPRKCF
ncbi:TPA: hypothetical protein ACHTFF_000071 [Clostridioides difficile]|uniref:Vitamin B12 dependent methionine synthase, activation domain n=6 Tax=Clostridioides difficile TaxID=1496 RepID=A0A069AY54_CLODI|nr:vitamin B12 dependent methionine synthase activation domain protein [Clostridioides difficile]EQG75167.1 vitamin B12 dependent methionine synthase, activation domain protein [Clostridioides difficile DA00165]AXU79345.1 vitamin B12 dependent methionine synthase, activation domain-containing protein [Clostridioides difficile]EAA0008968.1 hypothetical protein [Clostridioides difficile]EGT3758979.1 hypothetical protein [Clostridioides difficile]EGT3768078.1 hypothetical protein [Clostridioides 